jgi:beta-glucosidase
MKRYPVSFTNLFKLLSVISVVCLFATGCSKQDAPAYKNPDLPVEERISDLISRMTLEEKTAQLRGAMLPMTPMRKPGPDAQPSTADQEEDPLPDEAKELLKDGLGEIARPSGMRGPREMAEFTNNVQKWVRENTRLGIPILFHEECLHGHSARKGTSFPQAIALGSTWDPAVPDTGTGPGARSQVGPHGGNV